MGRLLAWLGLATGLFGLIVQFVVSMQMSAAVGRGPIASVEFFFSFYTVLTNVAAVMAYAAALWGRPAWFHRPSVGAGIAVSIAVVSITYATILANLWQPQGWHYVADAILHYVAPLVFVVWWIFSGRSGASRLADIAWWLVYPLAYLVYVVARGAILSQYPYPFLDLTTKTAAQVATSSLLMLGLFVVVSLIAVAVDRLPAPRSSDRP